MEEIKVENQVDEMLEEPSGEDMLLAQIDAFRDKAKQLQTLISAKERKVKELEAMVRAKEERNNQLQEELAKKQAEADGIAADVETLCIDESGLADTEVFFGHSGQIVEAEPRVVRAACGGDVGQTAGAAQAAPHIRKERPFL